MTWELLGQEPVGFDERQFDGILIGDETIKIEHYFDYPSFPGLGYALISNIYANDERDRFIRSYPVKSSPRIYEITVPEALKASSYLSYHLMIRRNVRAQILSDANWTVKAFVWRP